MAVGYRLGSCRTAATGRSSTGKLIVVERRNEIAAASCRLPYQHDADADEHACHIGEEITQLAASRIAHALGCFDQAAHDDADRAGDQERRPPLQPRSREMAVGDQEEQGEENDVGIVRRGRDQQVGAERRRAGRRLEVEAALLREVQKRQAKEARVCPA